MKRHTSAAGLALIALALLGLACPVAAGEQVPFHGSLAGVELTISANPPIVILSDSLTGSATLLGRFTLVYPPHEVNLVTMSGTGSFFFTGANGDMVSGTSTGTASPTDTPGVFDVEEAATITGGTGRFAGATGGFTVERVVDTTVIPFTTSGSFDGTISSPGR
jgi:hypothetical protein